MKNDRTTDRHHREHGSAERADGNCKGVVLLGGAITRLILHNTHQDRGNSRKEDAKAKELVQGHEELKMRMITA